MFYLPPPGGAAAATRVVSSTFFQAHSLRSQNPYLSIKNLRSSIGGCAPYSSVVGILISSTKMAILLFGSAAPYVVLVFFSSFSSMDCWVKRESVWAEKLIKTGQRSPSLRIVRVFCMITDFPTPVVPVKKTGLLIPRSQSRHCLCLYVSAVGTISSK